MNSCIDLVKGKSLIGETLAYERFFFVDDLIWYMYSRLPSYHTNWKCAVLDKIKPLLAVLPLCFAVDWPFIEIWVVHKHPRRLGSRLAFFSLDSPDICLKTASSKPHKVTIYNILINALVLALLIKNGYLYFTHRNKRPMGPWYAHMIVHVM